MLVWYKNYLLLNILTLFNGDEYQYKGMIIPGSPFQYEDTILPA